jgi:hypothetical protein
LNNVRRETSRISRNKKREVSEKISINLREIVRTNIRTLHRGINEFKKGYQPRTNKVKDENVGLLAYSQSISIRRKNYLCQQ